MPILEWFEFTYYMLRPRALKWCWRMNSFERICYSYDYTCLIIRARRERLFPQ